MSAPSELRTVCVQLQSTPVAQLPQVTPLLLRNIARCRVPLSAPSGNAAKSDASETSVLVHKLKTHVSTLLNGRSIEGKFVAVVLIKGLVDVGGWEILRGAEPWTRGLLAIITKPQDPLSTKRLAIIALTTIYTQTHQYQSLVREITTPTLPTFVTSCLALIVSKAKSQILDVPPTIVQAVFEAFATLLPRHPAIFRPFSGQIKKATNAYLAPTLTDARIVPETVKESACALAVLVHQTSPKNTSGEEWGKAIRALVKELHGTTDQVFRAVVEDWESSVSYVAQPVDVNKALSGGGKTKEDYPAWVGIDSGVERLTGLLAYLEEHFKCHTATAVTVPIGVIDDLLTRLMSVAPPASANSGMRTHPAISREEREGLWAGMPAIHTAVLDIYATLINRFSTGFTSLAQGALEHIAWTFKTSKVDEVYRTKAYEVIAQLLPLCGTSLPKISMDRLTPVIRAVCKELRPEEAANTLTTQKDSHGKATSAIANADSFLKNQNAPILSSPDSESAAVIAAKALLPLFYTDLAQNKIEAYLRAEIDRTAILTHHKEAMIASVLHPYVGKNGKSLPSILPHLTRAYPRDAAVEAILRPRMPVIRQSGPLMSEDFEEPVEEDEDLIMGEDAQDEDVMEVEPTAATTVIKSVVQEEEVVVKPNVWGTVSSSTLPVVKTTKKMEVGTVSVPAPVVKKVEEEDSDDESVHLEAGLSDSEDEEEE